MADANKARQDFERYWLALKRVASSTRLTRTPDDSFASGQYIDGDVQMCWMCWQAAEEFKAHRSDLLAACEAAADLLLRCDAEIRPNDLPVATDEDWDTVAAQLQDAIAKAKGVAHGR